METKNPTATLNSNNTLQKNDNSNPQQGSGMKGPTNQSDQPAPQTMKIMDSEVPSQQGSQKECRKLFVGGLPQDITEAEFHEFFAQFGEITDSVVMFDRETHRSRGFGFVTYEDADAAARLLRMGHEEVDGENDPRVGRLVMRGKTCEVKAAEPKESSRLNRRINQANRRPPQKDAMPNGLYHQATVMPSPQYYSGPHDPHYAAPPSPGPAYPMYAPGYFPAYHPAMHGGGAYVPASMYAPVPAAAVPVPVPMDNPQLYATPLPGPVEGNPGPVNFMEQNGSYPVAYAAHPYMMQPAYSPPGTEVAPITSISPPGAPLSTMQPAAPGLPNNDESN